MNILSIAQQVADELGIPVASALQYISQNGGLKELERATAGMDPYDREFAPSALTLSQARDVAVAPFAALAGSVMDLASMGHGMDPNALSAVPMPPMSGYEAPESPSLEDVPGSSDWIGSALGADIDSWPFIAAAFAAPGGGKRKVAEKGAEVVGRTIRGGIPIEDALIVQHNLSQGGVRHADKMGGLPMPSIGIAKASQPIEGYGDVTLLGGKDMAKPAGRNPVYSADAYSPRYPSVQVSLTNEDTSKLQNFILEPFGVSRENFRDAPVSIFNISDDIESRGFEGLRSNKALQIRFLHERGELPDIKKLSKDELDSIAQDKVNGFYAPLTDEYMNWVSKIPGRLGIEPRERIFAGYTNAGNRKYVDHTLDNVVSEMKKELKDNNQTSMYGSGALRAQFAPRFRNITEIKDARGRIGGALDKDELNNRLFDISEKVGQYSKHKYDDNPFIQGDIVRDQLVEISTGKSKWDDYFSGVPDELKSEWSSYIDDLKNAPTDYFEAKPQRAVGLGEFSSALVPENAPDDIVEILARQGLNIERYTDEADRARRMMAKENLLFQHPAATILGGSLAAALLAGYPTDEI